MRDLYNTVELLFLGRGPDNVTKRFCSVLRSLRYLGFVAGVFLVWISAKDLESLATVPTVDLR